LLFTICFSHSLLSIDPVYIHCTVKVYRLSCTTSVLYRRNFLSTIYAFCLEKNIVQSAIKKNHTKPWYSKDSRVKTSDLHIYCHFRRLLEFCHFIIRIFVIAFELRSLPQSNCIEQLGPAGQWLKIVMTILHVLACTSDLTNLSGHDPEVLQHAFHHSFRY
jgi:hypothetical protein